MSWVQQVTALQAVEMHGIPPGTTQHTLELMHRQKHNTAIAMPVTTAVLMLALIS